MNNGIQRLSTALVIGTVCGVSTAGGPPLERWERTWESKTGNWAIGDFVASAPDGDVYVGGREDAGSSRSSLVIIKYESDGTLAWFRQYEGPGAGDDVITDLEATPEGVSVLAASPGLAGPETVLLNYASDGTFLWEARNVGPALPGFLQPQLAIGADGQRVVATDDGEGVGELARYAADGTPMGTRPLSFTGFGGVSALTLDSAGNAYLVSVNDFRTYLVEKIDADGNVVWSHEEEDNTGLVLSEAVIEVDDDGDIVVAGSPEIDCEGDGVTIKGLIWRHGPDGTLRWRHELPLGGCDFLLVRDLALGGDGETYLVGSGAIPSSSLLRIDVDGSVAWTRDAAEAGFTGGFALVEVNTHGQVIVAANESLDAEFFGVRGLCYEPDGTLSWTALLVGEPGERHFMGDLAAGGDGSVAFSATRRTAHDTAIALRLDFAACLGDLDDDGGLDFGDVIALLAAWGPQSEHPADFDGDGRVTFADLLVILGGWGPCGG